MLLSDIDTWNVGALQSIAHELGGELATIEGVASDLEVISRLPGWDSPAADAARGRIAETTGKVLDDAAVIGAVQQLASETAAAVAKLHTELDAIRADIAAQGGYLTLSDSGNNHVYVMSSPDDPVSGDPRVLGVPMPGLGDLNQLGPNPLDLPLQRLSTDAAITGIDQVPRDASHGHSDYPRSTDNGLRTAGYNLAIIAAGLADDPDHADLLVR